MVGIAGVAEAQGAGMKVVLTRSDEDYPLDVSRVQQAVVARGYNCTRAQARDLWQAYSDSMCAHWLLMDGWSEGGIWKAVEPFIEEAQ